MEKKSIQVPLILFLLTISSCASTEGRSHQNFKTIMQAQVGLSIHDPYTFRNRYKLRLLVGSKTIANGNLEEEFKMGIRLNCRVFFEIDKSIEKVVGWRYEGSNEYCAIPP